MDKRAFSLKIGRYVKVENDLIIDSQNTFSNTFAFYGTQDEWNRNLFHLLNAMKIEMAVEDGSMDGYSMELIKQSYKNLHCSNPYLLNLLDENMRRDNFEIIFDSKVPKNEIHLCKGDITKTLKVLDLPHNF